MTTEHFDSEPVNHEGAQSLQADQTILVCHRDGDITTAAIDPSGACTDLFNGTIEAADLMVAIGGRRIVSRSSHVTSTVRFWVHSVTPGGIVVSHRSSSWASLELLTAPAPNLLLGVSNGRAMTARVEADGRVRGLQDHVGWDPWTLVSAVGNSQVLCYNASHRTAALVSVDEAGGYADVASYTGFDRWSAIVASGLGPILFYEFESGAAATAVFGLDGQYADLHTFQLDPGWRHVVPIGDGHFLFHAGASGKALASLGRVTADGHFHDGAFVEPRMDPWPRITSVH